MNRIVFFFFYLGLTLFKIIPFSLLYGLGYVVYVFVFHVFKYRKKIVVDNLSKCFPNKSKAAIYKLAKQFYKTNLSAIFVEGLKGFTMSKKQFKARYTVLNPEILDAYFERGQDVIALASHYTNWEWGIQSVGGQIKHQAAALYKPLSNAFIEAHTKGLREKMGMTMVPITQTRAFFESKKDKPVLYIMAADQFPGGIFSKAIWVNFLGRETACIHGPESYAKFNNLPTVFFDVNRVKRGYYELYIKPLIDDPLKSAPGELTEKYMQMLEEAILRNPADWLWSHKRWKMERKK
jgi:KDO2-lipid IV(A) lauroyltransferase